MPLTILACGNRKIKRFYNLILVRAYLSSGITHMQQLSCCGFNGGKNKVFSFLVSETTLIGIYLDVEYWATISTSIHCFGYSALIKSFCSILTFQIIATEQQNMFCNTAAFNVQNKMLSPSVLKRRPKIPVVTTSTNWW